MPGQYVARKMPGWAACQRILQLQTHVKAPDPDPDPDSHPEPAQLDAAYPCVSRSHTTSDDPTVTPVALAQLMVPCQLTMHLCNMRIPVISDMICQGSFEYCMATQARTYGQHAGGWTGHTAFRTVCLLDDYCPLASNKSCT